MTTAAAVATRPALCIPIRAQVARRLIALIHLRQAGQITDLAPGALAQSAAPMILGAFRVVGQRNATERAAAGRDHFRRAADSSARGSTHSNEATKSCEEGEANAKRAEASTFIAGRCLIHLMEPKRPTSAWPVATTITLVVALAVTAHSPVRATARPISMQPAESKPVTLKLECVDSTNVRFELANIGATDTALRLGTALANGHRYMIDDLNLRMKPPNGNGTEYHYWPRDYPVAIGGRVDQWFQAFPVGAVYRMSAKAEDFFAFGRQPSFPPGVELSLRWNISAETPKNLFPLIYWTGTLISNSCTAP